MMSVFELLIKILSDNFPKVDVSTVTRDTMLASLNMDSLDRLEFAVMMDEEFDLDVTDEALDEMIYKSRTVGELVSRIENEECRKKK